VTEDWYFVSHRLDLAMAAKKTGYDVAVATRVDNHGQIIRDAGIELFDIRFNRGGMRPWEELWTIRALYSLYRRVRPEIVHHVAMKPVIYGSLAAKAANVTATVNALGGLGYVFSSTTAKAKTLRLLVRSLLKLALSGPNMRLILQNGHDQQTLSSMRVVDPDCVRLIRGAGVDPDLFQGASADAQPPLIILPARLLKEKGVGEFVAAAKSLKEKGINARFVLVGRADAANPASFSPADIKRWVASGLVEAWGWREDMPLILRQSQIVCLPSYHEGFPKALLEAAASGCAIVATDIPGCRELIMDEETGLLVPPKNWEVLAQTLERLINDPALRKRLGTAARDSIISDFSLDKIVSETLAIYDELLPSTDIARQIPYHAGH
jgi:glycosyltransferase involved in cell wall biosynthesis